MFNKVREHVLDNGLKVLLAPNPASPALAVMMWYRAGSRNELPGLTGISHWVEHMLFKGGTRFKPGQITDSVTRLGGEVNGFTSTD